MSEVHNCPWCGAEEVMELTWACGSFKTNDMRAIYQSERCKSNGTGRLRIELELLTAHHNRVTTLLLDIGADSERLAAELAETKAALKEAKDALRRAVGLLKEVDTGACEWRKNGTPLLTSLLFGAIHDGEQSLFRRTRAFLKEQAAKEGAGGK